MQSALMSPVTPDVPPRSASSANSLSAPAEEMIGWTGLMSAGEQTQRDDTGHETT